MAGVCNAPVDTYPGARQQGNEGWGTSLELRFHFLLDVIRKHKLWNLQVYKDFMERSYLSNCQSLPFLVMETLSCPGRPFEQSFWFWRWKVRRTHYSGGAVIGQPLLDEDYPFLPPIGRVKGMENERKERSVWSLKDFLQKGGFFCLIPSLLKFKIIRASLMD